MQLEWKLFPGASVDHLYGRVWVLSHESRTDGFPTVVAQNGEGGVCHLDAANLTPGELRAIANWLERTQ